MKVFAISDLHLSGKSNKPMNVFGPEWEGHFEKKRVRAGMGGAFRKNQGGLGAEGLGRGRRPSGRRYLVGDVPRRGDVRRCFPCSAQRAQGIHPRQPRLLVERHHAGARSRARRKLHLFAERLRAHRQCRHRGLARVGVPGERRLYRTRRGALPTLIALIHYPPFGIRKEDTLFTQLFEENAVDKVVFGHLHGSAYFPLKCEKNGIEYFLTSCDKVRFTLTQII